LPRILLIDDDPAVRSSLARLLEADGHSVATAEDGATALRVLGRERVDLVITDVMMPELDGFEFLTQMRRMEPRPPVIVISGGGRSPSLTLYQDLAKRLGAAAALTKPVILSELRAHIRRLVGEDGMRDENA
jgi:DNA-binding response OmpR family regulator